jgi:hypothetical protein
VTYPHRTEHPSCTLACYTCRQPRVRVVALQGETWEGTERRAGEKATSEGWLSLETRSERAWLCGECVERLWERIGERKGVGKRDV